MNIFTNLSSIFVISQQINLSTEMRVDIYFKNKDENYMRRIGNQIVHRPTLQTLS